MSDAKQYPSIDPAMLQPNPWNTNKCSPEAEDKIEQSIRELGFFRPIVVRELPDGTLEILGGQHRVEVAVRMGLGSVPYFNLGFIDDATAKKIGLADNSRYGQDDTLGLAALMEELGGPEQLGFLPYSDEDFEDIFGAKGITLDDLGLGDDEGTPPVRPPRVAQTHVLMRFKVPVDDAKGVTAHIERVIKEQRFTEDDSLTNAGHALIHILKEAAT